MNGTELWHNLESSWLKEKPLSEVKVGADELLVKSVASLVSQGTERLIISSALEEELCAEMSFPMIKGEFNNGDFTYGYSLVGEVIKGAPEMIGQNVHLLHPHQSYAVMPAAEAYLLPENIDLEKATLISNVETVINAVWDSQASIGDRVLIMGYGVIGALLAEILSQIPGLSVEIKETDEQKNAHAEKYYPLSSEEGSYDLVFHTTGTSAGLQYGIERLKKEGSLIELSWYGNREVQLSLGKDFHYHRKKIISSQVSSLPLAKPTWDYGTRKALAVKLLENIHLDRLITKKIPFSAAPAFYQALREGKVNEIGTIITY